MTLGFADDAQTANGSPVIRPSRSQGSRHGRHTERWGKIERLTVRQALKRYIEYKRTRGQPVYDVQSRGTAHILPS
jgi:hypothetical protein